MRRLLALPPLVAIVLLSMSTTSSASTYTASGFRCTKVGTSGADRLYGTSGRDVICGMGGNDVIYGYGGDDVLDGGSGNDTLYASTGNDRLYGGSGNDVMTADSGADTAFGDGGDDRISGGSGNDVLAGKDGADKISGDTGADKEYGGAGNDTIRGGDDGDTVLGEDGNDDLSGDAGSDALDGGAGTNWCTVGSTDTQKACVYDKTAPSLWWSDVSPDTVDVTYGDKQLLVRLHLVDDTGVSSVQAGFQDFTTGELGPSGAFPRLVSGTIRDGIWEDTVTAHRYSQPGDFELNVMAKDRVGRWMSATVDSAVTVRDATPDREDPVVTGVKLSRTSVDARSADTSISTIAHITDDAAGVEVGDVVVCLYSPGGDSSYVQHQCDNMERYQGTARDGSWEHTSPIPRGSVGGDWNVAVWVFDEVHEGSPQYYFGEDVYRAYTSQAPAPEPSYHRLANARFTVLGATDNVAAKAVALNTDKTSIDTLPAAQVVHLRVHAQDAAGEGVTEIGGSVTSDGGDGSSATPRTSDGVRVSGTAVDGWWQLTVTFPQGTPPGRYPVAQIWVVDKGHWRSYTPPSSPYLGQSGQLAFPSGSIRTADGAAWDGVITVVQNPGTAPS